MVRVKPFAAVRPAAETVTEVASLPYDVMNRAEAKEMAARQKHSFLRVARAEILLDDAVDEHDERVYRAAAAEFRRMLEADILRREAQSCYYLYRQKMAEHIQTGLVCCVHADDYRAGRIKIHEHTRPVKVADRARYIDTLSAHTEPVLLTYRELAELSGLIEQICAAEPPVYDFVSEDGIGHQLWPVVRPSDLQRITQLVESIDFLYVADGHHRSASAVQVAEERRQHDKSSFSNGESKGQDQAEYLWFPAVCFPHSEMKIMPYHRVVKDLNGHTNEEFLQALSDSFEWCACSGRDEAQPAAPHQFGMYLAGQWYRLNVRPALLSQPNGAAEEDRLIRLLDVQILQDCVLQPLLGIDDPRTDQRIDFIGGIRGAAELERRVAEDMAVAFSCFATSIDELLAIADADLIMPPKSTWFEPKLRSGLFVHEF